MQEIRIGLIGFGMIGKLHTLAYRNLLLSAESLQVVPRLVALLRSVSSRDPDPLAQDAFEIVTRDPEEFFAQNLDVVDICTPNYLHISQAQRALEGGLAVYCEKPLGLNYEEALQLAELAENRKAVTQVAYTMRYSPAIRQIKDMLDHDRIGRMLHFRAYKYHSSYLDESRPISWRLRAEQSGGGAFQDLGSHLADLSLYLLASPVRLSAQMRTHLDQRPASKGSLQLENVDVDDWAQCLLELLGGGLGTIEVSRLAAGVGELTGLELYGSKGAIRYSSDKPETVMFYDLGQKSWQVSETPPTSTVGERPIAMLWPQKKFSQGDMLNRHMAAIHDFLLNVSDRRSGLLDFRAAARAQEVVEAAYRSARQAGAWIDLPLKP
jgi:predicted dehydrogenase